ncbi:hypothetical protein [Coleofasciculus sp. H7-2]
MRLSARNPVKTYSIQLYHLYRGFIGILSNGEGQLALDSGSFEQH